MERKRYEIIQSIESIMAEITKLDQKGCTNTSDWTEMSVAIENLHSEVIHLFQANEVQADDIELTESELLDIREGNI